MCPSILKLLDIVFKQCVDASVFLCEWKKGNIVPIHKKGDKQTLKNYRPVSLLSICGKSLERLMFNEMFKFFIENDLISSNQSEVRGVFLDILKAFDKVWHDGIIFKLTQN